MDNSEKAKDYAAKVAGSVIQDAIEKAYSHGYAEGYNIGYEAGKADLPKEDDSPSSPADSVEFVDLGLPSGTLWANDFLRDEEGSILFLPYVEAVKYNIPTAEQWEELKDNSIFNAYVSKSVIKHISVIGLSGKSIKLESSGYCKIENQYPTKSGDVFFIINSTLLNYVFVSHYFFHGSYSGNDPNCTLEKEQMFQGYRFPILLVKSPE